jgi:GxxExxY protein
LKTDSVRLINFFCGAKNIFCHRDTGAQFILVKEKFMAEFEPVSEKVQRIGTAVVSAAFAVHKNLGPGLLEKVYEVCLCHELSKRGISTLRQLEIPIQYDGIKFEEGLRLDILAGDEVIIELKAVDQINPVWEAQVLSHLKLTGKRLGYLINFNVPTLKSGIKRMVV